VIKQQRDNFKAFNKESLSENLNIMIDKIIVQKTLNAIWISKNEVREYGNLPLNDLSSLTSVLINNIFGGEILKKQYKNGWHFYNRINGERIDFTQAETINAAEIITTEDLPSSTEETYEYFEQEDYSTFYMEFIKAFEEEIGLGI
jgi:hypothetical protein